MSEWNNRIRNEVISKMGKKIEKAEDDLREVLGAFSWFVDNPYPPNHCRRDAKKILDKHKKFMSVNRRLRPNIVSRRPLNDPQKGERGKQKLKG